MVPDIIPVDERYVVKAAKKLHELADRADNGEIVSFIGICEVKGGGYFLTTSGCPDRHRLEGMLLELAVERVTED